MPGIHSDGGKSLAVSSINLHVPLTSHFVALINGIFHHGHQVNLIPTQGAQVFEPRQADELPGSASENRTCIDIEAHSEALCNDRSFTVALCWKTSR